MPPSSPSSSPLKYTTLPQTRTLSPRPFTAHVPDTQIERFKQLLALSELGPRTFENSSGTSGSGGESGKDTGRYFGVGYEWTKETRREWLEGYDWRKTEAKINSYPNYTVDIKDEDGEVYNVHFVALFSENRNAVPVMLLHGWPGSFLEFLKILDLLTSKYPSPSDLPFHVIVPSLPGYAYSSGPSVNKDMNMADAARVLNSLMVGLGFGDGYVAHGGDVGSFLSRMLVVDYPACVAAHLNFCVMGPPKDVPESACSVAEINGLRRGNDFRSRGNAYAREHSTRPATIGVVLSSNPLALLAWIAEKFQTWTDQDPTRDEILDSVSLYWYTQTFARCIYPYRWLKDTHANPRWHVKSPKCIGYSWFPFELSPIPKAWVETTGNLVWCRHHESGGHFAAMEKPDELLQDIEDFVKQVWTRGSKL